MTWLILWALPAAAWTQITLAWEANTEPDLAGYRVFSRLEWEDYDYERPDWEGTDTTCTLDLMDENAPYCFVARAFDTEGFESIDSNEACQSDIDSSLWNARGAAGSITDSSSGCFIGSLF